MRIIIYLILVTLAVTSCSRNNDEPEITVPVEKTSYNFVYGDSYKINDIALYKGPKAIKEIPQEDFIQKTWSSYTKPEYSSVEIDLAKKIIHLKLGSDFINYQIESSKDSIYTSPNKVFIGVLDKKKQKFELFKSFYYIKKNLSDQGISYNRATKLGTTKFNDVFGTNTFNSPSEMTSEKDEVFWANLSFTYKE